MPLPKVPIYGDAARLEQIASGLKREHGTYGSVVERNEPGRPSTGVAQQPVQIPAEHQSLSKRLAEAEAVRQQWAALAASSPTPWILSMADISEENYQTLAAQFYTATPNFEP